RIRDGMRTMTVTDEQREITDFEKTLDAVCAAGKKGADDAASASNAGTQDVVPRSGALRTAIWQHLRDGGVVIKPPYSTFIAIGVDDAFRILSGRGDDVVLGLSDGTTMTGAEYLAAMHAGELGRDIFAGLFHPV